MTKSIYRSGRVVYVWDRHDDDVTGFYMFVRGGRHFGPYAGRQNVGQEITNTVTTTPRREATVNFQFNVSFAKTMESIQSVLASVNDLALAAAQKFMAAQKTERP